MATILFLPFAEMGHVNPTLRLGRALRLRGHRVTYLGLLDHQEYVSAQGLDFIPLFVNSCPKGFVQMQAEKNRRLGATGLEALRVIRSFSSDPLKECRDIFQKIRPDLFITDVIFQDLALMAEQAGIPGVLMSTGLSEGYIPLDDTYRGHPVKFPVLIPCPREFDFPDAASLGGRFHIEASIDLERKEPAFAWHTIDESKPLLYCSLGSQSHEHRHSQSLFQSVIEAMRERQGWEAILATGTHLSLDDQRPVPRNVHIVNWVPQLEVLKRASVMITHGGLGSVKECIFFDVPMIVLPVRRDQPLNAARVLYHGLGLTGNIDLVTAADVGSMLDRIHSDPSFKGRVRRMGEKFRQIEGSGVGVRVIESILASSSNLRTKPVKALL